MKIDCIIGMSLDGRIDWIKDPATLQEIYLGNNKKAGLVE
jgi:hypothetical protein